MKIVYHSTRFLVCWAFRIYTRVEIIGYENLPKSGQIIVAPNHVSYLDPPLVGSNIYRTMSFMARHDLWNNWFLRWLLPQLNAFPVNRDTADRKAIKTALHHLSLGRVLIMFPEGTRSRDGKLQPLEPGLAMIVNKSGAPVIPVALVGPERILPPGQKKPKRFPIKIIFGSVIHWSGGESRQEILDRVSEGIQALLNQYRGDALEAVPAIQGKAMHE